MLERIKKSLRVRRKPLFEKATEDGLSGKLHRNEDFFKERLALLIDRTEPGSDEFEAVSDWVKLTSQTFVYTADLPEAFEFRVKPMTQSEKNKHVKAMSKRESQSEGYKSAATILALYTIELASIYARTLEFDQDEAMEFAAHRVIGITANTYGTNVVMRMINE